MAGGSSEAGNKAGREKREIDLTLTQGRTKGRVLPSLFEVDGNTLKLALPGAAAPRPPGAPATVERPKELKSETGLRVTLYTFEQDTKATREQTVRVVG